MAINTRLLQGQYVAFAKVTTILWNKMQDSDKLDNTLYFVVDGADDDIGQLYLGKTLIADGSGVTTLKLTELSDVHLKTLRSKDILMYNLDTLEWENVSLSKEITDAISVFTGATVEADGAPGLVPQATATVDLTHYLRGDGQWADPTAELKTQIATLVGADEGKSAREIAQDEASKAVAKIVDNAPESFDTLKEIADWIGTHPDMKDITTMQTDVSQLKETVAKNVTDIKTIQDTLYTETTGLVDKVTKLDTANNNLTVSIENLKSQVSTTVATIENHTKQISSLEERLTWQEVYEE